MECPVFMEKAREGSNAAAPGHCGPGPQGGGGGAAASDWQSPIEGVVTTGPIYLSPAGGRRALPTEMVQPEPEPFGRAVTSARARSDRTQVGLPAALPDAATALRGRWRPCAGTQPPPVRPPTPGRHPAAARHGFRPPTSPGGALGFPAFSLGGRRLGGGVAARGGARAGRGGPRRRAEKNAPSSLTVSPRSPWQRRAGAGPACSGE